MKIITTIILAVLFTANLMAQVPNYVPTNGLVGWWPFTGNANDSSGNGNNGTVNGATLTMDRFGNANKAYNFDGVNDYIQLPLLSSINNQSELSLSFWINTPLFFPNSPTNPKLGAVFSHWVDNSQPTSAIGFQLGVGENGKIHSNFIGGLGNISQYSVLLNQWTYITFVFNGNKSQKLQLYTNGIFKEFVQDPNLTNFLTGNLANKSYFGGFAGKNPGPIYSFFNGKLDDIGIWNRALSECEILALYNSQLGSFRNTPINVNPPSNMIGTSAVITSSKPLQTIQWQSNSNEIGWVNLSNSAKYNGVTNDTLIVSNLQVSNHNQAFRAIACTDTSNIAYILITDTCITKVTKYDTITTNITKYDTIKVMDTLVINATLSGISAPNNTNRIIVYPNPAKDHITIDYGIFSRMSGYTMKITNTLGQTVFSSPINQQSSFINLSTWTGKGLYYLQIIDPNSNMIENRKIVLQ
jgi:hypothetical protein